MHAGAALLVASVLACVTLAALTGLGERRRSRRKSVAVLAGLLFPIAWVAWYVRDERCWRRSRY